MGTSIDAPKTRLSKEEAHEGLLRAEADLLFEAETAGLWRAYALCHQVAVAREAYRAALGAERRTRGGVV